MQFFLIYCREAHPIDGNNPGRKAVEDPITNAERRGVAAKFVADMDLALPALLDGVEDAVGRAYASHPDRLYLIGKDGLIAYAGDRGPFGFKPQELREAIEDELMLNKSQALPPPTSLRDVLDVNRDDELSVDELANATEVLQTLDKNGDGKLSGGELPSAKTGQ